MKHHPDYDRWPLWRCFFWDALHGDTALPGSNLAIATILSGVGALLALGLLALVARDLLWP